MPRSRAKWHPIINTTPVALLALPFALTERGGQCPHKTTTQIAAVQQTDRQYGSAVGWYTGSADLVLPSLLKTDGEFHRKRELHLMHTHPADASQTLK